LFGVGPTYVAYPQPAPVIRPHHRWIRHSHRQVRRND
jgi:hypothetical protein